MGPLHRCLVPPLLGLVGLAGCAGLTPPPRQIFDTSPIAAADLSAPLRLSEGAEDDEDPAVVRTDDGTFHVVWAAKDAGGQVDLFARSSRDARSWSAPERITDHPDADYYPALAQARDGTLHLTCFRLQRKAGRMDIWSSRQMAIASRPLDRLSPKSSWFPKRAHGAEAVRGFLGSIVSVVAIHPPGERAQRGKFPRHLSIQGATSPLEPLSPRRTPCCKLI